MIRAGGARSSGSQGLERGANDDQGDHVRIVGPFFNSLLDLVNARPAAVRAEALKDKHSFKAEMDAEARRHLFRHVAAT